MAERADFFAERLLQVVDEGRRTATYKLALLTALIDACAAGSAPDGRAPATLHTRVLARHVLRLYLPQVRGYLGPDGAVLDLRQITMKASSVLGAVLRIHLLAEQHGVRGLAAIEARLPAEFARCLDTVELTFARYPLQLLQVIGQENRPFLYELDWTQSVGLNTLHAEGGGLIRFRPGAGDQLLRLAPLVRPLIELHWTRMVARINRINVEDERLHRHLFGNARSSFPRALRSGLSELQDNRCFYCADRLRNAGQIDHVIPWSRWPNDAVENLVLADACNTHKRDYLPAPMHVAAWTDRLTAHHQDLAELAGAAHWESDPTRTVSLARAAYANLPAGTPLWSARDQFTEHDPALLIERLAGLTELR